MSEKVVLNKSFNSKKNQATVYLENDKFCALYNKNGNESLVEYKLEDIKTILVINGRCPRPIVRFLCFVPEVLGVLSVLLAITFRHERVLAMALIIIGVALILGAAVMSKVCTSKAPEAIEITINNGKSKKRILGCQTTSKDYNSIIRLVKECKKVGKHIAIDMQSKL